jgi:hypothetical protein
LAEPVRQSLQRFRSVFCRDLMPLRYIILLASAACIEPAHAQLTRIEVHPFAPDGNPRRHCERSEAIQKANEINGCLDRHAGLRPPRDDGCGLFQQPAIGPPSSLPPIGGTGGFAAATAL